MFRTQGLQQHESLVIRNRMHVSLMLNLQHDIHKPVTGTNNMKKCNQRLLAKATPKICDQKRFAVQMCSEEFG